MKFLKLNDDGRTTYIAADSIVEIWGLKDATCIETVNDHTAHDRHRYIETPFEQVAAALEANATIIEPGAEKGEFLPGEDVFLRGRYHGPDGRGHRVDVAIGDGVFTTLWVEEDEYIKRGEK
jgi:hypothetical protein